MDQNNKQGNVCLACANPGKGYQHTHGGEAAPKTCSACGHEHGDKPCDCGCGK